MQRQIFLFFHSVCMYVCQRILFKDQKNINIVLLFKEETQEETELYQKDLFFSFEREKQKANGIR